jgi:hypothetical protein
VKKLAVYNEMKNIYDTLDEFTLEVREYYRLVEFDNTSSNFFSRPIETNPVDVLISRYGSRMSGMLYTVITLSCKSWRPTPSGRRRPSRRLENGF